jgi:1-deoxy-D-xylulose-5-phosphate reductoisomerase
MKRIAILGSTGSIGTQTLDVIANDPELYQIEALAAGHNVALLAEQVKRFQPKFVSVATKQAAEELRGLVSSAVQIGYGDSGVIEAAAGSNADFVVSALVGSQGLRPTMAAIEAGKHIGLANKETLVTAGHLVTDLARKHRVQLLPIDSEHSAIFQCLNGEHRSAIDKIILTASGGSFRDKSRDELSDVTVEDALKHPNWSMGAKITIDSATMANKGLEVIEAHWLFGIDYDRIEVVIHPESIIHSMVQFTDYSVIAQLGNPDMRVPIQYALTYPERRATPSKPLDLVAAGRLQFRAMDFERYPCIRLAYESGKQGGSYPTVFNAANEMAVSRFLRGDISFLAIDRIVEETLNRHIRVEAPGLSEIEASDAWARTTAASIS